MTEAWGHFLGSAKFKSCNEGMVVTGQAAGKHGPLFGNAAHHYRNKQWEWRVPHGCVTGTNTKCPPQGRCGISSLFTPSPRLEAELQQTANPGTRGPSLQFRARFSPDCSSFLRA